jgi:hypothetical protein
MTMPEQIRKQSEAVAKLYEELNADANPPQDKPGDNEVPVETKADSDANGAPASEPNEQGKSGASSEETFEQRYRSLQGMYNADTARLRSDNQQLGNRVAQLEQLLSNMSSQATTQQSALMPDKLVTAKDVEDYGDSIEVMRRVSKEETAAAQRRIAELEQMVRQMQSSVLPKVEQVAYQQAVTTEQAFWSDLTALAPDWREINGDQNFHSWLLTVDPLTGYNRQVYLEDAQRNFDARRVASFFTTWKGMNGQSVAQPSRATSVSELDRQVSPGRSRGGSAPVQNQPKTYSGQDISEFYAAVRRGEYRGKEAERDQIERDIFAAQRESRIVANG